MSEGASRWIGSARKLWLFDGCKWSRFHQPNAFGDAARAAQADGPLTVRIAPGDRSRAIRLDGGAAGAPRVRVTTPGGQRLDAPDGPGVAAAKGIRILGWERLKATVIGLQDSALGRRRSPRSPARRR